MYETLIIEKKYTVNNNYALYKINVCKGSIVYIRRNSYNFLNTIFVGKKCILMQ